MSDLARDIKSTIFTLTGVMLPLLNSSVVQADRYTVQVRSQDEFVQSVVLGDGWMRTHRYVEKIVRGDHDVVRVTLEAEQDYRFVGFCDEDCADVDLVLYDENGHEIDRDTAADDMPLLSVRPSWTGPFFVHILVPDCRAWQCTVGLSLYKDTGG